MRDEKTSELIANAVSHGLGFFLATFALVFLLVNAEGAGELFGILVFGISLILLYLNSTLYHSFPMKLGKVRRIFRRFDHAAIYLLIAGTYTPFVWILVPNTKGYALLVGLWLIAIVGIVAKVLWIERFRIMHVVMFLAMGWSVMLIWEDVYAVITAESLVFLLAGGVSYTLGVAFYATRFAFSHFVWHLFVLGGSLLHFFSIYHIL